MRGISFSQKGASLVEFALLLPLLMLITFGIIEFGLLFYNQQVITNASREGARAGVVYQLPQRLSQGEIQGIVNNYADQRLVTFGSRTPNVDVYNCSAGTASSACTGALNLNAPSGSNLRVVVRYDYNWIFLPINQLEYTAESVMRYE